MCRSQSADNVESRGPVGAEAEPLWGLDGRNRLAEARREQLALYVDFEATGTRA